MMNFCVTLMDYVLGWSLHLPHVAILALLAVCTAVVLTGVRKFTTNQDLLGRAKADKARLKVLMRAAKQAGDKEAVKRYRATNGEIGAVGMKAELLPLAAKPNAATVGPSKTRRRSRVSALVRLSLTPSDVATSTR